MSIITIISLVLLVVGVLTLIIGLVYENKTGQTSHPFWVAVMCISLVLGGVGTPFSIADEIASNIEEVTWTDMATNPTCYSTESLAEAHMNIVKAKYWSKTPFSFHKGYDFPEINVDVMENTNKFHFVK